MSRYLSRRLRAALSLCALLLLPWQTALALEALPIPKAPEVGARGYLLVDFDSGQILAEKAAEERLEPASITKLMSAYVIFKELQSGQLQLDELVTISEKAWRTEGSRMFVEVGSQVPVEDLLRGIIVQSGNDATVALAEHVAGTESTFAAYMNRYAEQLGLTGSHFTNSTGLPDPQHYTTAGDIARLARTVIAEFPEYYPYYSEREYTYNGITQSNRNRLLWRDDSVDGLKTGHTEAAGYCLVTSALRDGQRLISVVLGASSEEARAKASQALLNYGFRFFETHRLYDAGQPLKEARIWQGARDQLALGLSRPLYITIPRGRYDQLGISAQVSGRLTAPVAKGQTVGSLQVQLGNERIAEAPLVALDAVEQGSFWQRTIDRALLYFE